MYLYCSLNVFQSMLGEHESSCFHGCLDVYVAVLKILHAIEIKSAGKILQVLSKVFVNI